jgi:hypothetical protein
VEASETLSTKPRTTVVGLARWRQRLRSARHWEVTTRILRILPIVLLLVACGGALITRPRGNRPIHYALLRAPSPAPLNAIVATLRRRPQAVGPNRVEVRKEGNQIRLKTQATTSEFGQMMPRFLKPGIVTINLVDDTANAVFFQSGRRSQRAGFPAGHEHEPHAAYRVRQAGRGTGRYRCSRCNVRHPKVGLAWR